jgi:cyclic-di-GMP-binding protein
MLTKVDKTPSFFSEFNLPKQDLSELTFCASNPAKVKQWLESLPVTDVTQTSIILYKSLPEVCRLQTPSVKRINMLEALYPYVHRCIEGLIRELIQQPLILSAQMMKLAVIAQALQRHLNDGYMIALRDLLQTKKATALQQPLALCLYRATSGLSLLLLRSYQLYTPQPTSAWLKLHTLYQFAIENQLEKIPVKDPLLNNQQTMTVSAVYRRNLLLACSSPYQLRQVDIAHVFQAFSQYSSMVQLTPAAQDNRRSLYWVSLKVDKGPFYNRRLRDEPDRETYAIHLEPLIHALEDEYRSRNNDKSKINFSIPHKNVLITHLLRNWKEANIRLIGRQCSSELLEICIGLTTIHSQLLGDNTFESLVHGSRQQHEEEAYVSGNFNRSWGLEGKPMFHSMSAAKNTNMHSTDILSIVKTTNSSTSGYCLIWDSNIPSKVRVGELVGIRQSKHDCWQVGIICWAQRHNYKIYTGVQLLSKKAIAYAARTLLPDGNNSPYFRSLLLTDSAKTESHRIITPSIPFEVGQTIHLRHHEEGMQAYLTSLLLSSTSVSQFTCQPLSSNSEPVGN